LDRRWQALDDHGRLKFFSRETLTALLTEAGLEQIQFETVGRIPSLARSMLAAGRAPMGPALKP
jgi:2-polyprenyl-6-hydroxyphenyl methylase/3-demethylubiquinone-9 3-methyltransferase